MNLWQKVLSPSYDLDKVFAISGIILSLLMISIGGAIIRKIVFLLVGALILLSCLIWLAIRGEKILKLQSSTPYCTTSGIWAKAWAICFFVFYIASIFTIYLRLDLYERPTFYLLLTIFMTGAIAFECLAADRRHIGLILIQILLLGMSIGWSQMLIFPGVNGVDAWYHSGIIQRILHENYIPSGLAYSNLPILHLLVGIASLMTTLPIKFATMFTASFGQITANVVFIFLIASSFFKDHRIWLLSALMVVIGNWHIRFSYLLYPNAFGMIFVMTALYLLFCKIKDVPRLTFSILFTPLLFSVILTHSILAVFMAVILFLFWGASTVYSKLYQQAKCHIWVLIPIGFTVAMFGWWTYVSIHTSLLGELISVSFSPEVISRATLDLGDVGINMDLVDIIFSILPFYLFVTISLIGGLYMISRSGSGPTFTYALLSIIPLLISFSFYVSGGTAVTERWFYFAQILLSIPLSLVIYWLGVINVKRPIYRCLTFFILMAVFSSLMITGTVGNHDNFSFPPKDKDKIYHTDSELTGYQFFVDKSTGKLSIDGYSIPVFKHYYGWDNFQRIDLSYISGEFNHDKSTKLLRHGVILNLQKRGLLSHQTCTDIYYHMSELGFNRIYDNSGLIGYA